MESQHRSSAPLACMIGVIAWTWAFLGIAILTGRSWLELPTVLFTLVGFLGPVVVPSLLILAGRWHESLGTFWRRCLDPTTLPARWWAVVLGLVVVLAILPVALRPDAPVTVTSGPITFLLVGVLAGAVEEPAWRGYGQAALQGRMSVVMASLVVGVLWAAWHLPMFLLEGTYQHGLGIGTEGFWTFLAVLVVSSPIYAWLLNASGQVVFAAVLFHAAGNLGGELIADAEADALTLAVTAAVAALVVAAGWRWMRGPGPGPEATPHVG